MAGPVRSRFITRVALAAALVAAAVGSSVLASGGVAAALPAWTGGIDLYRPGVFTTQQTWLWCTAADIQIIRNIVDRQTDHSAAAQQSYFDYMRAHDRYAIPVSDGVDPAGWTAGLQQFVDPRYRLVASTSFDSGLRSAVTSLRLANRPVGITVQHGNHAWILTGFTATADPAVTTRFTVTSVQVVGPLWGLQSRTYGYDMRPDTTLTPQQLAGFFTPWHYARVRMAWEGRWVSVQPLAGAAVPTAPAAPVPSPRPAAGTLVPPASPAGTASPPPTPTGLPAPAQTPEPARSSGPAVAGVGGSGRPATGSPGTLPPIAAIQPADLGAGPVIAGLILAVGALVLAGLARHRRRSP